MSRTEKLILIILTIAVIALGIAIMTDSRKDQIIIDDFDAPSFDSGALVGVPQDVDQALRHSRLAVSDDFAVWMCVDPVAADDSVQVFFTSEEGNQYWTKLQLLTEDGTLIGESGLIRPGEYVETIPLMQAPKKSGLVIAKILSYEQDTYYSKGTATAQVMLHIN